MPNIPSNLCPLAKYSTWAQNRYANVTYDLKILFPVIQFNFIFIICNTEARPAIALNIAAKIVLIPLANFEFFFEKGYKVDTKVIYGKASLICVIYILTREQRQLGNVENMGEWLGMLREL